MSSTSSENYHCYNCKNRDGIVPSSDPVVYECSLDHSLHFATESCSDYTIDTNLISED